MFSTAICISIGVFLIRFDFGAKTKMIQPCSHLMSDSRFSNQKKKWRDLNWIMSCECKYTASCRLVPSLRGLFCRRTTLRHSLETTSTAFKTGLISACALDYFQIVFIIFVLRESPWALAARACISNWIKIKPKIAFFLSLSLWWLTIRVACAFRDT